MTENENIITMPNNGKNNSLNEFLIENGISGRLARRLFKRKLILVNGCPAIKDVPLRKKDTVTLIIEDEECDVEPQDMELEIIYEDRDVLVINKPPFIVVYPTVNISSGTLSNGVSSYYKKKGLKRKIRLVNRLDRDTSGIIVYAKNSYAHQYLARQMETGEMKKKYIAVVQGGLINPEGVIESPIGLSNDGIRQEIRQDGLPSITKFKVIENFGNAALLELELITGRTHQIRVHLSSIGNPIMGDTLYGDQTELIDRQALHACSIEFKSPVSGQLIQLFAPLPEELTCLINGVKELKFKHSY